MRFLLGCFLGVASIAQAHSFTSTYTPTSTVSPTVTATPTATLGPYCASVNLSITVGTACNYGAWDGVYAWWGDDVNTGLYRIAVGPTPGYTVFATQTSTKPLCVAYDGANVWVGSSDANAHLTEYSRAGAVLGDWQILPGGGGYGGVQGILWDGTNIWLGISQISSYSLPCIGRWNTSTHSLDVQYNNALNTNGISYYYDTSGVEHIVGVTGSTAIQINGTTGALEWSFNTRTGYTFRVTNDGTYAYVAEAVSPGVVEKIQLSNGALASWWYIGSFLNSILFDGLDIWTVGSDHNVNVTDTSGNPMCQYLGQGVSDVIFTSNLGGQNGGVITLNSNNNSGTPANSSGVWFYALNFPFASTSTSTSTPTSTPTATPTKTLVLSATETQTASPYPTPNPTHTFTPTISQTWSASPTPTSTPNWTATASPTAGNVLVPTATPTPGFF